MRPSCRPSPEGCRIERARHTSPRTRSSDSHLGRPRRFAARAARRALMAELKARSRAVCAHVLWAWKGRLGAVRADWVGGVEGARRARLRAHAERRMDAHAAWRVRATSRSPLGRYGGGRHSKLSRVRPMADRPTADARQRDSYGGSSFCVFVCVLRVGRRLMPLRRKLGESEHVCVC